MFRFLCQGWKISIIHWEMLDKQTESVHNSTWKISSLRVTFFFFFFAEPYTTSDSTAYPLTIEGAEDVEQAEMLTQLSQAQTL